MNEFILWICLVVLVIAPCKVHTWVVIVMMNDDNESAVRRRWLARLAVWLDACENFDAGQYAKFDNKAELVIVELSKIRLKSRPKITNSRKIFRSGFKTTKDTQNTVSPQNLEIRYQRPPRLWTRVLLTPNLEPNWAHSTELGVFERFSREFFRSVALRTTDNMP